MFTAGQHSIGYSILMETSPQQHSSASTHQVMASKRKASEAAAIESHLATEALENLSDVDDEANAYEKQRMQMPKPAPRKPKEPKIELQPTRRSSRLHPKVGEDGEVGDAQEVEPQGELAMFLVDGECPKCGRVIVSITARRKHFERCTGPPELPQLTEEELAAEAAAFTEKEIAKLRQLELNLLVEATDDHATFIVIGSTGNHYKVQLSDAKRSCQCVDHRCRKHDCKHIRLVLTKLGIMDSPADWREGVERHFAEQIAKLQHGGDHQSDDQAQPATAAPAGKGKKGRKSKKPAAKEEAVLADAAPQPAQAAVLKNPAQEMALNFM